MATVQYLVQAVSEMRMYLLRPLFCAWLVLRAVANCDMSLRLYLPLFACSIHNKPVSKLWEWTAVESVPVVAKAMLPSSSAITIQLGAGVRMITFVNTVPISENKCINRWGPGAGCWLYTHAVTCSALSGADASTVLRCPGVRHVYSYSWANPVNKHRHRHIVDPM